MKTYLLTLDAHGLISEPHRGKILPTLENLRKDLIADLELALGKEWALQVIRYEEVAEGLEQLTEMLSQRWPQATIVSLDRHLYRPHQAKRVVGVSRYSLSPGSSENMKDGVLGQGPRPGAPTIEIQLDCLPGGRAVILTDGGSFSGEQLAFVANEVRTQGLEIAAVGVGVLTKTAKTFLEKCCLEVQATYYFPQGLDSFEWVEERDFWPGFGGRVLNDINTPNLQPVYQANLRCHCQMPYILPYGDPVRWASLPKGEVAGFSNRQLFRTVELFTALEKVIGERLTFENIRKVLKGASFPYCERKGLTIKPSMRVNDLLRQDLRTFA